MSRKKKSKIKKNTSSKKRYAGMDRREHDDPNYFGYFIMEGRERRWAENLLVTRMERAISEVLARLHEYKHLAPYGGV